ncbi:kti12, chromatin associated [Chamberlinius hualienensis]
MPLILMCGLPCSGKSRRARELQTEFENKHNVLSVIVSEESSSSCQGNFERNSIFSNAAKEKELRGHIRSEVQRALSKDQQVVIVDSPNYIKGYRYELYCLSKANKTTYCVVHCDTNTTSAWEWNQLGENAEKVELDSYTRQTFDALVARFEAPDSRNRWDSPLFTLQPDDELPIEPIYNCLFLKKPPPANQSTQSQPLLDTNFLYNLDKVTQDIVYAILEAQKMKCVGDEILALGDSLSYIRRCTQLKIAKNVQICL